MTGQEEMLAGLKALPGLLVKEARKGMNAAGQKITRRARSKMKKGHGVETGQLRRAMGVRSIKFYEKENKLVMYVGPRGKKFNTPKVDKNGNTTGKIHSPIKIGHLVEFGHRIVTEKRGLPSRRNYVGEPKGRPMKMQGYIHNDRVEARPFLVPAVDESRSDFQKIMAEKIKLVVEKRITKG
jgi:hypothetical protein